ncbi:hypothetical protein [Flavonifractor phage Castelnaud]|nr:hypothetical protein [Flavonifractor phage Castelnaud]
MPGNSFRNHSATKKLPDIPDVIGAMKSCI